YQRSIALSSPRETLTIPKPIPMPFHAHRSPTTADQLAGIIARALDTTSTPAIARPVDYARAAGLAAASLGTAAAAALLAPCLLPVLRSRGLWRAAAILLVLLFASGHMFNRIRKVAYVAGAGRGRGRGGARYFARGHQTQVVVESQLVAAMYGTLALATVILAVQAPRITSAKAQHLTVAVCGVVVFAVYGGLMSVFRIKNAQYPF
ncbi:oligosaccharyl transferase subunit ost3/OST6, partial [Ascosphaera acerosa]